MSPVINKLQKEMASALQCGDVQKVKAIRLRLLRLLAGK